jgi:hypothetical protein
MTSQAGYSQNPLIKKLGIKDGYHCLIVHDPPHYLGLLGEIPATTEFTDNPKAGPFDFIHVFVTDAKQLKIGWPVWKAALKKDGMLWLSWPKQTSSIPTGLNGNLVRQFGLDGGLVDTKVCAVDHDWSGLKFMYRKTDR